MMNLIEQLEGRTLLTVTLDPVAGQDFPGGKSIFVPVTGTTDSSSRVSYSASTDNAAVTARVLDNLTFLRMNISIGGVDKGYLEFALFNEIAPNTVGYITSLVNSGFYNNLTFHRVIPGFMAQGGAGAEIANINDEFHPDAIFSTEGLLAMANANRTDQSGLPINDTNNSQFFVTVDETRWLDFRHTIFGQLMRGQAVLDQIMAVGTSSGATSQQVKITSAAMVQNNVDTVVLVKGSAAANITIQAQDHNSTANASFAATSSADTTDDPPYLQPILNHRTTTDMPLRVKVAATDIDGTPPAIQAIAMGENQVSVVVSGDTMTVTPISGFIGTAEVLVAVWQRYDYQQQVNVWDSQRITVTVEPGPFAKYNPDTRTLQINGTSTDDQLSLSIADANLRVNLNGVSYDFGLAAISTLDVTLGDGNDNLTVASNISLPLVAQGGAGNDTLIGGAAGDLLYGNDGNDSLSGGDGVDTIYGNFGEDVIAGGLKRDSLLGGIGNDTITGGDGPDSIYGGDGTDLLRGGKGADYIEGKGKADTIYGGSENDTIYGHAGSDLIYAEAGDDEIRVDDTTPLVFRDTVYGGDGQDGGAWDTNDSIFEIESDLLA